MSIHTRIPKYGIYFTITNKKFILCENKEKHLQISITEIEKDPAPRVQY